MGRNARAPGDAPGQDEHAGGTAARAEAMQLTDSAPARKGAREF